ncbi:MAG: NTP transferase domain-containing protein [Bacteroidota bacterium]|nr:NTP transferase domain-containing protein [Bacteroidota bacterium]
MQIIIPMSGIGKRFLDAGYAVPKFLIDVDGKPMIEHVVNMFPGEHNFNFICNSNHLKNTNIREVLERIAPHSNIVEIAPHKKGPVYALMQALNYIDEEDEVIVNYCDFSCYWNYNDFLEHTRTRNADGAIPAYKGFHPHMIGMKNYAFMRDNKQWMLEIKEKEPFTDNRMNEFASTGTYYFKKGSLIKHYFKRLIELDINVNGEYYVSLVYNLLVGDGLKVSIYEVQHMLQWGTPEDLEDYLGWSNYFSEIINKRKNSLSQSNSTNLIPLAGKGKRFEDEGYSVPKPLIEVSGKPMIIQASSYLPEAQNHTFICLGLHLDKFPLEEELKSNYPDSKIVRVNEITQGQACTCELGLEGIDLDTPLLIAACDNGMLWNSDKYDSLVKDSKVDAIVWSFRHNASSRNNPYMYGWIKTNHKDDVEFVSVKKPISNDPYNDHAVIGTFYFKKAKYFLDSIKMIYEKEIRINNEFYVDSCVNELLEMGLNVKVFEVDNYICWGTPNDLKTFEYWQSFFQKCNWHQYSLKKDVTVNVSKISELNDKYNYFRQEYR